MIFWVLVAVHSVIWFYVHRFVWKVTGPKSATAKAGNDELPEEPCWFSNAIARCSVFLALHTFFLGLVLLVECKSLPGQDLSIAQKLMGAEQHARWDSWTRWLLMLSVPAGFVGYAIGWWALVRSRRRSMRHNSVVSAFGIGMNFVVILFWVVFAWHRAEPFLNWLRPSKASVSQNDETSDRRKIQASSTRTASDSEEQIRKSIDWEKLNSILYPRFNDDAQVEKFARHFESKGYRRIVSQVLKIEDPITEPTIFFGQRIEIDAGANADIVLIGQRASISSTVVGNVEFIGQVLTVKKGGSIDGDLNSLMKDEESIFRPRLKNEGKVTGNISGIWDR